MSPVTAVHIVRCIAVGGRQQPSIGAMHIRLALRLAWSVCPRSRYRPVSPTTSQTIMSVSFAPDASRALAALNRSAVTADCEDGEARETGREWDDCVNGQSADGVSSSKWPVGTQKCRTVVCKRSTYDHACRWKG